MALSSMTGFARSHGVCGSYAWAWEIKSVNGKGLDLRLRLPPGWDAIEVGVRSRAAETLARGSIQAGLTVERTGAAPVVRVNAAVLDAVLATARQLARQIESSPPTIDGLLGAQGRDGGQRHRGERGGAAQRRGRRDQRFCRSDRRARRNAPARRRGARPSADDAARARLPSSPRAPISRRDASPRRSARGLPNRSRHCWHSRSASIRTGCIRKRS